MGGVWLVNGGVCEGLYHLLKGMSASSISSMTRPQAHLLVDIGTYEARVVASVIGSSTLADTYQTTSSGYKSFLCRVMQNYQHIDDSLESKSKSPIVTLEDANALVQAWEALSSSSSFDSLPDSNTMSVELPSRAHRQQPKVDTGNTIQISIQPLLKAFHHIYLDYTNPSSLIFAMLTCVMKCPIDYRKAILQNTILVGGGSVALRHFCIPRDIKSVGQFCQGFGRQLEIAIRDACGISNDESMDDDTKEDEKKDNDSFNASPIAKQHFQSLRGAVNGCVNQDGGNIIGGINIQYPDPFAADLAAWLGGSVMGTLGFTQYRKK